MLSLVTTASLERQRADDEAKSLPQLNLRDKLHNLYLVAAPPFRVTNS